MNYQNSKRTLGGAVREMKNWNWFQLFELYELNMSYKVFGLTIIIRGFVNEYFYKKVL